MKKSEFDRLLKPLRGKKGLISPEKVKALPAETKNGMATYIVRHRMPLLLEFAEAVDQSWLHCMGYLHLTTGPESGLTFWHTAAHIIK